MSRRWSGRSRPAYPEHGEDQFAAEPFVDLAVYLDDDEHHTYKASKVVHNCLLADRFPNGERPIKGNLEHGWPPEIQDRLPESVDRVRLQPPQYAHTSAEAVAADAAPG